MVTNLDVDGQRTAYAALQGRKGAVVAIEPRTGKVRVMASVPEYDPNLIPEQAAELGTDPNKPILNRTTQEAYPPGSTFKVVTATAAIDSGKVTPDTVIDGSSPRTVSGVPLENFGGTDFGPITVTDALTNSVNTVFAQIGEEVGRSTLVEYMQRYGFYEDPKLDYPEDEMIASGVRERERRARGRRLRRRPRGDRAGWPGGRGPRHAAPDGRGGRHHRQRWPPDEASPHRSRPARGRPREGAHRARPPERR